MNHWSCSRSLNLRNLESVFKVTPNEILKIGITCFPSIGGSGILASALGQELARIGHEVHFISYERPFRMPLDAPRIFFHQVMIREYGLFKYPDYTLPLSVKMAEVSQTCGLDIQHVHYAVPHAIAALFARAMLPANKQPKIITTLHGTDTVLLGSDPGYGPAIRHALERSDAVTAVSEYLRKETRELLSVDRPIDVIHNFYKPDTPKRSKEEVRRELGLANEVVVLHSSNLRQPKRIDLLLQTTALIEPREAFKLVILAGDDFSPWIEEVRRLGLEERVIVRAQVKNIDDYLQIADIGLITSESESFCLSILETMYYACPSVATRVGGIPEVMEEGLSGLFALFGDAAALAAAVSGLIKDPARRVALGQAARKRAQEKFSAEVIVPHYEALYRRVIGEYEKKNLS
jgi:L-malate glycosyltransferase